MRPAHLQHGTLTLGILTGALAGAATAGALLGFGVQQGTPARPFNAVASLLLSDRADGIWGFHPVVTLVGVVTHLALTLAWGLLFARLARGMRGLRLAGTALLVTVVAFAVDMLIGTQLIGANVSDVLAPAQVIALHVVLGVTLAVGMRLATAYLLTD